MRLSWAPSCSSSLSLALHLGSSITPPSLCALPWEGLGFLQEQRQQGQWGCGVWGHTGQPTLCPGEQQVQRIFPCEVSSRTVVLREQIQERGKIALQGAALLSKSHPGQAQLLWQPCSLLRTPCGLQRREVS